MCLPYQIPEASCGGVSPSPAFLAQQLDFSKAPLWLDWEDFDPDQPHHVTLRGHLTVPLPKLVLAVTQTPAGLLEVHSHL